MKSLRHPHYFLTLSGVFSLGVSLTLGSALSVSANAEIIKTANPHFLLFEPPTDDTVTNSRGGASRPTEVKCAEDETYPIPLTALVPQSGLGLTARAHPTLFVYVPPTTATQVHFTLRDSNRRGLYQTQLPIAPTGGILNVTLPADSPELAVGSRYQWSLGLLCQSPQTDMPIASGHIQRVEVSEADAAAAFDSQPLWAQATAYGQAGIWHDMLASLVALQQRRLHSGENGGENGGEYSGESGGELREHWVRLLEAEQLGAIARSSLLNETLVPSPKE